jgi:hypothetical protein
MIALLLSATVLSRGSSNISNGIRLNLFINEKNLIFGE